MKKYIIYSLIMTLTCGLGACNNDEDVDKANSIFSTEEVDRSPFDKWILGNYTHPYNIALKYRMEDNESDMTHILAPAEYKKSVVLAKIIKHVWLEAYDEATGNPNFLRQYIPKTIHFIGSPAYEDNGTMVLGTAEGGMKITLYNVNDINPDQIDINLLNDYYSRQCTMSSHIFCIKPKITIRPLTVLRKMPTSVATGIWWEPTAMHGNKDLSLLMQ